MGKVTDYYDSKIDELDDAHRFHYIYRRFFWTGEEKFKNELSKYQPSSDLEALASELNVLNVNSYETRKEAFDKYPEAFLFEGLLFRVYYLLTVYNVDLRDQFDKLYSKTRLTKLLEDIMNDRPNFAKLSSYAVNLYWLNAILFGGESAVVKAHQEMAKYLLTFEPSDFPSDKMYAYAITHAALCTSNFYQIKPAPYPEFWPLYKKLFESIDTKNLPLDNKYEIYLTAQMIGWESDTLDAFIEELKNEAAQLLLSEDYIKDPSRPDYNTLNKSEHRNILFIMSGLDQHID